MRLNTTVFTKDRIIVLGSLIGITALSWAYLVWLAHGISAMGNMPEMAMSMPRPEPFAFTAIMWIVMMVGMMLPSAMPMILLFLMVQRKQGKHPLMMTSLFIAGYLVIWAAFAIAAAELQRTLSDAAILSPTMTLISTRLAGAAFILAGIFEITPLKNRCLTHCVNPLRFITSHWHPGVAGALRMGVAHGGFCLGCCWTLMLLLFVAGVMNLIWVATLTVLILLQKTFPYSKLSTALTGTVMITTGVVISVT